MAAATLGGEKSSDSSVDSVALRTGFFVDLSSFDFLAAEGESRSAIMAFDVAAFATNCDKAWNGILP